MRYRTRVFLLVILTVTICNLLLFCLMYVQTHKALFQEIQSTAVSIVSTGATFLDGDRLSAIRTREDEGTANYRSTENLLRQIRDANRRSDVNVAYLYTMMASPDNPAVMLFGVDSESSRENKSHVGDVYKGVFAKDFKVQNRVFVDETPSSDQWGTWITACAPVNIRNGRVVSMLCGDLGYADVKRKTTWKLIICGLISMSATLMAAIVISSILARHVSKPIQVLHYSLHEVGKGNFNFRMDETTPCEFGDVARTVNSMVAGLRQRDMLKGVFAHYVSDQILNSVLEHGHQPNLNGERRKITVLFSDIRNFTALSEQLSPEDVVSLLNEYFEAMVDIIFRYNGMLDKFMGDGMMVIFGAPEDDPYQEEHAITAGLEMLRKLKLLCDKWKHGRDLAISIGIGIHTGIAVVGNIGSQKHMEYTAIGDTVNLAYHIESLTKETGYSLLVSDYTFVSVRNQFAFKRIENLAIKGRKESVVVYAVIDTIQEHKVIAFPTFDAVATGCHTS
jgi:adenylate cyclase